MIEKFMGLPAGGLRSMGASMRAAELGALSQVAECLIKNNANCDPDGKHGVKGAGEELVRVLARLVRAEVLLHNEVEVNPNERK